MAFVYVIQEHLPKISYLTWMHWYCFFCFAFVFAVTADVVAVHYFSRHCDDDDEEDENSKNDEQSKLEGDVKDKSNDGAGDDGAGEGDEKAPLLDANAEGGDVEMANTDKKTDEEKVDEEVTSGSGSDRLMKQFNMLKNLKLWKSIDVTEMTRTDIEKLDSKMKKGIWSAFAIMNLVMFGIEMALGNLIF